MSDEIILKVIFYTDYVSLLQETVNSNDGLKAFLRSLERLRPHLDLRNDPSVQKLGIKLENLK